MKKENVQEIARREQEVVDSLNKKLAQERQMILLTKVESFLTNPHPNGYEKGYQRTGYMFNRPKIGERFEIVGPGFSALSTSPVTDILSSNSFKTMNSIYSFVEIDIPDD
jgi:hypothetical protein